MMCRVNSYKEEKLDFTTTRLLPRPCARWLADEDRLFLIVLQQAIPPLAVDEHAAVDSIL